MTPLEIFLIFDILPGLIVLLATLQWIRFYDKEEPCENMTVDVALMFALLAVIWPIWLIYIACSDEFWEFLGKPLFRKDD